MAEHLKSKSTGGFYQADVSPCNQISNPFLPDVLSEVGPPGGLEPVADLAGVHPLLLQVDLLHVRLQVPLVGRREGASAAGVNPPANTKVQ